MKKVLFLMVLLFLIGLGAGVKAQVRIGGNTAPSKAAVLDLNASDAANTGKGGLVLPRVDLTSNTMQLTPGVANQTGTLVYNVTTTLGQIGIFYWNGNAWVKASLPSTSAADSGNVLMTNGSYAYWSTAGLSTVSNTLPNPGPVTSIAVTWVKTLDVSVALTLPARSLTMWTATGVDGTDACTYRPLGLPPIMPFVFIPVSNYIQIHNPNFTSVNQSWHIKCYRASA